LQVKAKDDTMKIQDVITNTIKSIRKLLSGRGIEPCLTKPIEKQEPTVTVTDTMRPIKKMEPLLKKSKVKTVQETEPIKKPRKNKSHEKNDQGKEDRRNVL
jgi:hypothetical protein